MNREQMQDECLKLAEQFRQSFSAFDENKTYLIEGKHLKKLCKSYEILADSFAQVIEKLPT